MNVPFVDLKAQYLSIKDEVDQAISMILETTTFVGGPPVKNFEQEFANYHDVEHAIGCGNGTDTMEIILRAMGVGPGDEVIVPCNSWISTSEVVTLVGAHPVFADIREDYTIDPADIQKKITPHTRAVIPVHLYGLPADMEPIMQLAERHHLQIIEDCAQAHGAIYHGKKVGTLGDAGSFSFYPGKNLGAYGDAGAIITNNQELADKCRRIANHGQLKKHDHTLEGRNSRLDSMQAAILSVKLRYLDQWTRQRQLHAKRYTDFLGETDKYALTRVDENRSHVYHLYVVQVQDRDRVQEKLMEKGISTSVHYPSPLPFLPAYTYKQHKPSDFPVAWKHKDRILSLPMYAELAEEQVAFVAEQLKKVT